MIVIKDIVTTEKSIAMARQNHYTFLVNVRASKQAILQAVATQFGVHPTSVNVTILPRKTIKRGRAEGKTDLRKKAFVTLKKGEKIAAFEFPVEEKTKEKEEKKGAPAQPGKEKLTSEIKVVKREQARVKV